jgi:hypothetical protein
MEKHMIKPGYTYRAAWTGEPAIVYVTRRDGRTIEIEHLTGRLQDRIVTIEDRDHPWVEVCEGRHSNPEALLTQTPGDDQLAVGTVRIGKTTRKRFTVLALDGDSAWVDAGPEANPQRDTWNVGMLLRCTDPAPTFFEEGHDYERPLSGGGTLRVTVRSVGRMPIGEQYAVAEHRNGPRRYESLLLKQNNFPAYKDVTK